MDERELIAQFPAATSQEPVGKVADSWARLSEEEEGVGAGTEAQAGHAHLAGAALATGSGEGPTSALSLVL